MTARARIPDTAREGTPGAAVARGCGCLVVPTTRARGGHVVERCAEGERLWEALRARRDEMQEAEGRGERKGHKARIDAFAGARAEHARHVGVGV